MSYKNVDLQKISSRVWSTCVKGPIARREEKVQKKKKKSGGFYVMNEVR